MQAATTIVEGARAGFRGLVDLLLPPACMACDEPVREPLSLCAACWSALPEIAGARCQQCGLPLPTQWQTETHCLGCLHEPPPFERAHAPYLYDGPARRVVIRFKNGKERWAIPMAAAMHRAAPGWATPEKLLIPVPLHRWRLAARSYNQALVLARALGKLGGAEVAADWLIRVKNTPSTRGLKRAQRLRNVSGAFRVRPECAARLQGRHILMVDDVMTTGATAAACARVLRRAGAARVDVITYARVATADATPYLAVSSSQETDGQD